MKPFLKILFLLIFSTSVAMANEPKNAVVTVEYSVPMHCESCQKKVMNTIPFQKGVRDVVADLESNQVTVTFDPKKTTPQKIEAAFDKIKLPATPVKNPPKSKK